jgi:hypothetical protein
MTGTKKINAVTSPQLVEERAFQWLRGVILARGHIVTLLLAMPRTAS